jgi:hypothetical protein
VKRSPRPLAADPPEENDVAIYCTIICPECGHQGSDTAFSASCADECWCPKCDAEFVFEYPDDDDEDEDG